MTNRISVSNPTQPVISVTDEGGVLVTVNYQNSTGGGGGTGDVVGPASSTDNAIARYDGTTGKLIQDSGITIADGATGTLAGSNSGDVTLGASVTDIFNLTGQVLSADDQGADRLVFWDESENKLTALTAGSGLSISGTTITATATGDVIGPASSTDNALVRFDSTTGKLVQNGQITESDTGDLAAINSLAFDTTPTGAIAAQGEVMWNSDEETLDIQLNSFAQHVGEHVLYHVKNSTGSTIAKGVPVMFAGTNGASGKLLVQPWNGTGPSTYFMGLTAEELLDTEEGFVISFGKLRGIQTNGGNYGETWADGEIIYVGTTTGSLTKTQPAAPNPHIQVCAVVNAHASNGTLFIRPTLGSNIKDDEGVTITSLSSGQVLIANNAGTVFENKSMSGDATLANTGALTLATVNSNVGSFGSATAAPAVTVNAKGLVTAVSTNTITPAVGSITGLGTNVATSLANNMSASGTLAILGANTFTGAQTLSANGAASTPSLSITGSIFTGGSGSTNTPQVLIQPSSGVTANTGWSTSGTALGVVLPVTGTLANFLHFRRDNIPYLSINGTGRATGFEVAAVGGAGLQAYTTQGSAHQELVANRTVLLGDSSTGLRMSAAYYIGWSSSAAGSGDAFSNNDVIIRRDAAGILAQRNGTNAQSLRIYNTFTSATNYELASIGWGSNILNIGTEKGSGGGTARAMRLVTDATARAVFEATTFNTTLLASAGSYGSGSGVLFLGNATTAPTTDPTGGGILYVESSSLKFRGESGGNNTLAILGANTFTGIQTLPAGAVGAPSLTFGDATSGIYRSASGEVAITSGGTQRFRTTSTGAVVTGVLTVGGLTVGGASITDWGAGQLGFTASGHYAAASFFSATGALRVSSGSLSSGNVVQWTPLAANTVIQQSGVNAQAAYAANTYTSTTNYEAGGSRWTSNVFEFGTIKGSGGGTARAMNLMTDATARAVFEATTFNTTLLASAGSYGSGSGVLFLGNATTAPTTNPTGGGILYVEAGALKFRGSSGTVTTIANA